MSLFSILRSGKLSPAWEYRAEGLIWRLLPAVGCIVGEDRDHEQRTVSFFCIDEQTGKPLWKGVRLNETWWISIETVHQNVVFLHEFVRPDFPEHQKIIALALESGNLLWRNEDYKFMFAHQDCVYAMKEMFESIAVLELDLHTGQILRDLRDQPEYVRVLRETAANEHTSLAEYPNTLTADPSSEFAGDMTKHFDMTRQRGEIEIIEADRYAILGFYRATSTDPLQPELDQHLAIVDKEADSVVFSEVITRKGKMPVPDLFFVRKDVLYYVKDQNALKAVKLG